MAGEGVLDELFVYLFVALLAVPAAVRLGLGGAVGYLVAGAVIGPWGLALVRDVEHIGDFSRATTLLLLFVVALESTPARVERLVGEQVALGLGLFATVGALVFLAGLATGLDWNHALVAALALALASDALASEALGRRYPTGSSLADTGRQLLLTQHLLLVPIVVLLPALGFGRQITEGSPWPEVGAGALLICLLLTVGSAALRHGFRFVVGVGADELFASFALLAIVGTLLAFDLAGVPLELAALGAGFLLARSEYGSAIDVALRPFRGLIVGLFFVAFGMQVDFGTLIRKPAEMLALVALLAGIKVWTLRNLLRFSHVPRRQRVWLAALLAQGGELAFVVIALAIGLEALPRRLGDELVLIAALSMLATPVFLVLAEGRDRTPAARQLESGDAALGESDAQVIVAGFGRVGGAVARLLAASGVRVAVIDSNPDRFAEFRAEGFAGFYGDALRPELVRAAGAARAVAIVVAIDNAERVAELVRRTRREHPHLVVVARAVDRTDRTRLLGLGADRVHRETFESALLMGEDALETVGVGALDAQARVEAFRDAEEAEGARSGTVPGRAGTDGASAPDTAGGRNA